MVPLQIEHAITEFGAWKQAFDRFADMRRDSGVLRHRVHQPADDDRYVVIELDFGTGDEAATFVDLLTSRVWANPASAPALVGTPATRILDLVEQS
ncbi:MAG TPA: hypothetical protein VK891_16650 [Euzebyales bacterium]|nr:hypothetical protein [Euzebyales bacterium]